jgi:hypothetical protein
MKRRLRWRLAHFLFGCNLYLSRPPGHGLAAA